MSTEGTSRTDSGLRLSRPAMDKCPHFDSLWSFSRNCRQSHVLLWLTDQFQSDSSITSYSARPGESMQAGSCFGSCPVAEASTDGLGQLIGAEEQAIRKLWVLGLPTNLPTRQSLGLWGGFPSYVRAFPRCCNQAFALTTA